MATSSPAAEGLSGTTPKPRSCRSRVPRGSPASARRDARSPITSSGLLSGAPGLLSGAPGLHPIARMTSTIGISCVAVREPKEALRITPEPPGGLDVVVRSLSVYSATPARFFEVGWRPNGNADGQPSRDDRKGCQANHD